MLICHEKEWWFGVHNNHRSILESLENVLGVGRFRVFVPKLYYYIIMGDLNAKVGQDNYMLNHVMEIHGIVARNDNGERFVDFCSTNHFGHWWHNA